MRATRPATSLTEVYYPESDGKPMAETDLHRKEMTELIGILEARYADVPSVYVSGNLLLYYVEGDPTRSVAPDVFVVFGVPDGLRRVYKLWAEGVAPAVVIEVTSRKTKGEDLRTKRGLYARLGVSEYYLYDPEADYLRPPLQGFRLVKDVYEALAPAPDAAGTLCSAALGLDLRIEGERLQLYDVATGERLPRLADRAAAEVRAQARAVRAEREVARLRVELERLQGGDASRT